MLPALSAVIAPRYGHPHEQTKLTCLPTTSGLPLIIGGKPRGLFHSIHIIHTIGYSYDTSRSLIYSCIIALVYTTVDLFNN
eukprot:4766168-Pleurochrysis_carterae.AAC.3